MGGSCLLKYRHCLRIWDRIHEQNIFVEKHCRVNLSRLSGHRISEWYGARVCPYRRVPGSTRVLLIWSALEKIMFEQVQVSFGVFSKSIVNRQIL